MRYPHVKIGARTIPLISSPQSFLGTGTVIFLSMASEPRKEVIFEVKIKRLEGLPRRSFIRSPAKRRWYITLDVGSICEKTRPGSRGLEDEVTWDETFALKLPSDAKFMPHITLWQAHKHSNDDKVAVASNFDLVDLSQKKGASIKLHETDDQGKVYGHLSMDVQIHLPNIKSTSSSLVTRKTMSPSQFTKIASACQSWQPFLQAFRQAVDVARQISELDPTAKVALSAISFAITALVKQMERDQRVNELQEIMTSLLLFFSDVEPLRQSPFLRSVLDRLLLQVSECTYFVLQYREIESFAERAAVHLTTDTDGILNQFFATFTTLRAELALGTSLQTAINTEYILNKVNEIDVFLHIKSLKHLTGCSWRRDMQCEDDAREFSLNRILRWISGFQQGLFVLHGPPGSGKSALLHKLAGILDQEKRLGAGIFLNEHVEGKKSADSLLRTILYYLASSHPCLGKKIASAIAQHPSLDYADALRYTELLNEVTQDLVLYGPLVVIIDGLQDLPSLDDQKLLKKLLGQATSMMNRNIRFILSLTDDSLPEHGSEWWLDLSDSETTLPEYSTIVENAIRATASGELLRKSGSKEELVTLVRQYSLGCTGWLETFYELLEDVHLANSIIDGLKASTPAINMVDAVRLLGSIVAEALALTVFNIDFCHLAPGSSLFASTGATKQTDLHRDLLRYMKTKTESRTTGMDKYEIMPPHYLSGLLHPTNPPLLPTDSPLNIYQIRLRDAPKDGRGPVYARIALPISEPLVDGKDIQNGFGLYGVGSWAIDGMLANSPLEGCEWIILHPKLFKSETKDGYTSVMATTPVMTQAILERLVCIWVDWYSGAEEGTCIRLRDGKEETDFIEWATFYQVVYHGTHSELSRGAEKRGELRPGDQIQVKAKYHEEHPAYQKFAVIAMTLKY